MLRPRTLKFFAAILLLYGALVLPGFIWPSYADSPAGLLLLVPGLSIYLFHKAGVPGLLEHGGLCGWGWCAPTPFGWVFLFAFWLMVAWLLAWAIASSTGWRTGPRRGREVARTIRSDLGPR